MGLPIVVFIYLFICLFWLIAMFWPCIRVSVMVSYMSRGWYFPYVLRDRQCSQWGISSVLSKDKDRRLFVVPSRPLKN